MQIADTSEQQHNLRNALFAAFFLHLALALLLPSIPKLILPSVDRGASLTVFLRKIVEKEEFEQTLNQQLPLPANIPDLADPSLGSASIEKGDDSLVSDAAEPAQANAEPVSENETQGASDTGNDIPSVRFDFASVRLFAKAEAVRYAEENSHSVERFARTFNRSRNIRRRSKIDSYRNRLGDLYARSNSSDGDVCFKQQREQSRDDFSSNTVTFFRCDREPMKLSIDNEIDNVDEG